MSSLNFYCILFLQPTHALVLVFSTSSEGRTHKKELTHGKLCSNMKAAFTVVGPS